MTYTVYIPLGLHFKIYLILILDRQWSILGKDMFNYFQSNKNVIFCLVFVLLKILYMVWFRIEEPLQLKC